MASNKEINGNNVVRMDAAKYDGKYYRHLEVDGKRLYCRLNEELLSANNITGGTFHINSTYLYSSDNYLTLTLGEYIIDEIQKPRGGIFNGNEYAESPDWENLKKRTDYYFFAIINGEDGDPSSASPYFGTYDEETANNSDYLSYIGTGLEQIEIPLSKIRWISSFGELTLTPKLAQGGCLFFSNGINARTQTLTVPYIERNETVSKDESGWGMFGLATGNIVITDTNGNSQSFDFDNEIVSLRRGSTPSTNDPGLYLTINDIQKYGVANATGYTITYNNVKYIENETSFNVD